MLAANNSQSIFEPIHYVEENPVKILKQQKPARRKITVKESIKKRRKLRIIHKKAQTQRNVKLNFEYNLRNTVTNDPLSTPLMEVKEELNEEETEADPQDREYKKKDEQIHFDSDDDKDFSIEEYQDDDDDEEYFGIDTKKKMCYRNDLLDEDVDVEAALDDNDNDDDDDDKPLILLSEISPAKTYKKRQKKSPRLYSCLKTCKHKCTTKYNSQQRLDIFHYYWDLSDQEKVNFLRKHIRKPVIKRLRSKKIRNNCCYFLKYYKTGKMTVNKQRKTTSVRNSDEDEDLTKVCRKFFDGTLSILDREIKEAFKNFELRSERIVRPKNEEFNKLYKKIPKEPEKPYQYLDPVTGDLTDTKPKKKTKRRRRGEPPSERFPKPINCAIRCKFKCHEKFSEAERKQICDIFWSLDFKRRKDFILSRIETTDVKTPITPEFRKTNRPTRAYQTKFYLRSGLKGENVRVCKHFILSTLCTNRWFIDNAIEFADKSTGAYTGSDRRRTHSVHNKISEERRQTIRDDINSYPCWIPNKKSKSRYLHYGLSIIKMYEAYKKKCLSEQQKYVSKKYYYRVFHEDFQLLFLKNPHPKKGPGFLLSNPHISNYTGEEPGGNWVDFKGTDLDLSTRNPAERIKSLTDNIISNVSPEMALELQKSNACESQSSDVTNFIPI